MEIKKGLESNNQGVIDVVENCKEMAEELAFLDKFPEISREVHQRISMVLISRRSGLKDHDLVGRNLNATLEDKGRIDMSEIDRGVEWINFYRKYQETKKADYINWVSRLVILPAVLYLIANLFKENYFDRLNTSYLMMGWYIGIIISVVVPIYKNKQKYEFTAEQIEFINSIINFNPIDDIDIYQVIAEMENLSVTLAKRDVSFKAEKLFEVSEYQELNRQIENCRKKFRDSVVRAATSLIEDRSMIERNNAGELIRLRVERNTRNWGSDRVRVADVIRTADEACGVYEEITNEMDGATERKKVLK